MHVLGVILLALGVAGLLYLAVRIFWEELRRYGCQREIDAWAEDVQTWQ